MISRFLVNRVGGLFLGDPQTRRRVQDFFTAHIRNAHTRRAYRNAAWCQAHGIKQLGRVETIHVSRRVGQAQATAPKKVLK